MDDNSSNYNGNNNNYQPSNYHQPNYISPNDLPMTIGDWVCTILLLCIPIVGFILSIVWALSSNVNKSKKAYFQAIWILNLIILAITIIIFIIIAVVFKSTYY